MKISPPLSPKFVITVIVLCFLEMIGIASARTWTNTSGKSVEAEIVTADTHAVTLLAKGKEFKIKLKTLSAADQLFCEEWIAKKKTEKPAETITKPNNGNPMFDGKELVTGGKVNVFNYPYHPDSNNKIKKFLKAGETGFRIGISVPKGFDPSKPQKVFVANTAQNNAKQTLEGNTKMAGFFSKQCAQEGWVCFAFDSNLGRPKHNSDLIHAVNKMNEIWPEFKNWKFVVGGFSGGGKAAFWPAAYLLKEEYKVTGLFLANTNEDFSELARKKYKVKKSAYKQVNVFWGTGRWDELVTAEKGKLMKKSLERNGMKEVRVEFHEGKHSLYHPQFIEALKWFSEKMN